MRTQALALVVVAGSVGLLASCSPPPVAEEKTAPKILDVAAENPTQPQLQVASQQKAPNLPPPQTVMEAIDQLDSYYQALLMDESLTSKGSFGANRFTYSDLQAHGFGAVDPIYKYKQFKTNVMLFGNKGNPLNQATLVRRFERREGTTKSYRIDPQTKEQTLQGLPEPDFRIDSLIKAAAEKSIQGNQGPFTQESKGWTLQIRRVNLSKSECLPCHKGQKLGDPVALMAYLARKAS